jgi:hypothetical protein
MPQAVEAILHFNVRNRVRILYARGANNYEFGQTCKNNLRPTLGGFTPKFLLLPSKVLLTIFVEPSRSPSPA